MIAFVALTVGHLKTASKDTHLSTFPMVLLGVLTLIRPPFYAALIYIAEAAVIYVAVYQAFPVKEWTHQDIAARILEIMMVAVMAVIILSNQEKFFRKQFASRKRIDKAAERLQKEENRCLGLLKNVLPDPIVEKMRADKVQLAAFSHTFGTGSALVSDIVGFTRWSGAHSAFEGIEMLNEMFKRVDRATSDLHLEKIKTIGDAYVATGGVPIADPYHMEKIADLGLALISEINKMDAELGLDIQIRVGIASGSMTAGVVGSQKLCYDVYGTAIKNAEKMEQGGEPNL
eukprot:gene10115-8956_t